MYVRDILNFGGLKNAKVIAGKDGLDKIVTSISVLEVAEEKIKNWVLKNQLYITSFYAILRDIEMQKKVILALEEKKASGLVICHIDLFLKEVHPEIVSLCNEISFPLIIANSKKSYIEILNPIILKLVQNTGLEEDSFYNIQNKLIEYIATKKDLNYIYKSMTMEYGEKIFFLDIDHKMIYPKHDCSANFLSNYLQENYVNIQGEYHNKGYHIFSQKEKYYIYLPIRCKGLDFGNMVAETSDLEENLESQVKKLQNISSLCTLISTKSARIKELEIVRKQEYISDLITWNFKSNEIALQMGREVGWNIFNKDRMIIVNLNDIQENMEMDNNDLKRFIDEILFGRVKKVIRQQSDKNLIGLRSDMFLILLERVDSNSYERSKKIGTAVLQCCREIFKGSVSVGISREITEYKMIPEAYVQAVDAAKIGRFFLGDNQVISSDDMGFYSIFRELMNFHFFREIHENSLMLLKKHDSMENLELYKTLKVYIQNNMNTEETAIQLFVHRNTVNYRKKKIIDLLGYVPWEMPYLLNTVMTIVSDYFE